MRHPCAGARAQGAGAAAAAKATAGGPAPHLARDGLEADVVEHRAVARRHRRDALLQLERHVEELGGQDADGLRRAAATAARVAPVHVPLPADSARERRARLERVLVHNIPRAIEGEDDLVYPASQSRGKQCDISDSRF